MGIAANQARLMTLTARKNDLELRAQQISAIKMRLSQTTSTLAQNYSDALNNYTRLNAAQQLSKQDPDGYYVLDKNGNYTSAQQGDAGAFKGSELLNKVATALHVEVNSASEYLTFKQAEYTTETDRVSAQEKVYDMELTEVNTEHTAIKTEYDAIKSLIGDNVEKSFNVFG